MSLLRYLTTLLFSTFLLNSCSRRIQCAKVPGTVKIDNSYSVRATELTVREYLEFVASNSFDRKLYPDSNLLQSLPLKILCDDISKENNFKYFKLRKQFFGVWLKMKKQRGKKENARIKSLMFMPITGVTFDQATQYCLWLETKFNTMTQRYPQCKVGITLPTIEIYSQLIKNKDSLCFSNCQNSCHYNFNYNQTHCDVKSIIGTELTNNKLVRCDRFHPDNYGTYNLQGNAAEMTSTKNISMGGSFLHQARESYNDVQISYMKPEIWLGFRFVVTKQ